MKTDSTALTTRMVVPIKSPYLQMMEALQRQLDRNDDPGFPAEAWMSPSTWRDMCRSIMLCQVASYNPMRLRTDFGDFDVVLDDGIRENVVTFVYKDKEDE